MLQPAFSFWFPALSFMVSLTSVCSATSNVYVQCSQLNFTSMTPYESNLNSLSISLAGTASIYNFNKLEISPQTDSVYGLFQCRGDLSSSSCKYCVDNALSQLKTTCPMSTGGEIQLEGCFVKYDDTSFFGAQDKMEMYRRCGPSLGYNSDVMNRIDDALAYLVGGNGQYFRGGNFGGIQGVAQCVQDLSLSDCQDCLLEASGRLRSECETSTWGDMYLGKCYIRYADQGNLNLCNDNDDNTSHKKKGKRKGRMLKRFKLIGSNIASFVVSGGSVSVYTLKVKKKLKKTKRERDSAKIEAETAKQQVEKLKKELLQSNKGVPNVETKPPPCPYFPMPPPCPYVVAHSSPNTCNYL